MPVAAWRADIHQPNDRTSPSGLRLLSPSSSLSLPRGFKATPTDIIMANRQRGRGRRAVGGGGGASTSSAGDHSDDPTSATNIGEVLASHCVKEWDVPLKNITLAENSRQTSPTAVQEVVESIQSHGWVDSFPRVMFSDLTEGQEMTVELAATLHAVVIDGNHRLAACKEVYGEDRLIRCTCYRFIADSFARQIASDVCNVTTATFQARTIYDQLYFYNRMMTSLMAQESESSSARRRSSNSRSKSSVTAAKLAACWKGAGSQAPAANTLRQWISIVNDTSQEALVALRALTDQRVPGYQSITKAFLADPRVRELKEEQPQTQALLVDIYARIPKTSKKGEREGLDEIGWALARAKMTASWVEGIEHVVPRDQWSDKLKGTVRDFAFVKTGHYANYVKPHQLEREAEVRELRESLPPHVKDLDEDVVLAIRSKLHPSIRKVMREDLNFRPMLVEHEGLYESALNKVRSLKLQVTQPVQPRPRQPVGNNNSEGLGCTVCKAPTSSSYSCSVCKIHHTGGCANTDFSEDDETSKVRDCKDCHLSKQPQQQPQQQQEEPDEPERPEEGEEKQQDTSKRPAPGRSGDGEDGGPSSPSGQTGARDKGKRPRRDPTPSSPAPTLPTLPSSPGGTGDDLKTLRWAECIRINDVMPLSRDFRVEGSDAAIEVDGDKAMLLFVAPGVNDDLLRETAPWKDRLNKIIYRVCDFLHEQGTMIVHVPHSYLHHGRRISDALKQPDLGLVVEDNPLVVVYGKRGGGITSTSKANHLSGGVDIFLIAHPNGANFRCNKDVLPQNFPDKVWANGERIPVNNGHECVMNDVPYLGASRSFHNNVASWGIQRFTKQGDTVMTLTADKDGVVETALKYGRNVGLFITDPNEREGIMKRAERAFEDPWRMGIFMRKSPATNIHKVRHGTLPLGIPSDNTPRGIVDQIDTWTENLISDGKDEEGARIQAMIEVACKVARDFQWEVRLDPPEELGVSVALFALDAQRYKVGASDLPVWGEYIVYDSREEAYASIKPDDDAENLQYVRLLHVADTQLLRRMCKEAEESVVSEDAGLYLRVAKSCPAFYALWDESEDNAGTHEVRNRCARTDSTSKLVAKFRGTGSTEFPVFLKVCQEIAAKNRGRVVHVQPGLSVVRPGWYKSPETESSSDDEGGSP